MRKKKRNLIELDIIKTRVDGVIGIKLFLKFFHPQIEAGALGFARIYKAGTERVKDFNFFFFFFFFKFIYLLEVFHTEAMAIFTQNKVFFRYFLFIFMSCF